MKKSKKSSIVASLKQEKSQSQQIICSICLQAHVDTTNVPCKHRFCEKCITKWVTKHLTCPFCRKRVRQLNCPEKKVKVKKQKEGDLDQRRQTNQQLLTPFSIVANPMNRMMQPYWGYTGPYFNYSSPFMNGYGFPFTQPPSTQIPFLYLNYGVNNLQNSNIFPQQ